MTDVSGFQPMSNDSKQVEGNAAPDDKSQNKNTPAAPAPATPPAPAAAATPAKPPAPATRSATLRRKRSSLLRSLKHPTTQFS